MAAFEMAKCLYVCKVLWPKVHLGLADRVFDNPIREVRKKYVGLAEIDKITVKHVLTLSV